MKRSHRRFAGAALSALMLTSLAACGNEAEASGDALSKVELIYSGALTVCTDIPYEPFVYRVNGQDSGFDIDMAQAIADDLEVQLDVIDHDFGAIEDGEALNTDVCDVAISAITITGERARVLDFSSPYFNANQALVAPKGSGSTSLAALAGRAVGAQTGTTGVTYVSDNAPKVKVKTYGDAAALVDALTSGEVAAIVLDGPAAVEVVRSAPELAVLAEFDTGEQYGMAVKKDGNLPLLRRINSVLADIRADGTYDEIYAKYFKA